MPPGSFLEWQRVLDRSRTRIAEQIHALTHGRAVLEEVIVAVEATLGFCD
jgi:alkylated DNA nucleotide flippase Atl1